MAMTMHATTLNRIPAHSARGAATVCSKCDLQASCIPSSLSYQELKRLDSLLDAPHRLRRGRHLYRSGDHFRAIYVVRTGFLKTNVLTGNGREQVTGFQMAGEILGIDGIGSEAYTCDATALEDSLVCSIPFSKLEALISEIPVLQRHFHQLMSREIVRDHGVMMLLGTMRAEERLAAFLLNLSQRFAARGCSATEFHLRMTRDDIGSYLGLQLETISRTLSRFHEAGLIEVNLKHLRIIDIDRLKKTIS